MEQKRTTPKLVASIVVIAVVAVLVLVANLKAQNDDTTDEIDGSTSAIESTSSSGTSTQTQATATGEYKDGTYTIEDTYISPGGVENIKVVVTLQDNKVTDATVTQNANNDDSAEHQAQFANNYKSRVIGKAIATLNLSRISGASLTTAAFNDALDQIRNQAEA